MQHEIRESLEYFLEHGKRLIIVYPNPEMGWLVPNYLVKTIFKGNKITRKTGSTTYESFILRTKTSYEVLNTVGNEKNVFRIYPSDYSCEDEGVCLAHLDLQPLYFDDDHLTGLGAKPIAESIILSLLDK